MSTDGSSEPETEAEAVRQHTAAICPVIGIGASAGGIDALQRFFSVVPSDSNMAFVVVQHLDPDHRSILADVLSRSTPRPVRQIENGAKLEPNTVYVIPPNATLTVEQGRLLLSRPAEPRGLRTPIDTFLVSLAEDQGENAACVILSGTGSDGTVGLRAIKEHGGLTLAQSDAEYDGMMRSAVATGLVDLVLPVEEIPVKLTDYFRHLHARETAKGSDGVSQEATDYLGQIALLLRSRTGHDFKDYKDRTVIRRVQRRMQVLQVDTLPDFIARLQEDPRQVDLLFQDLLIGVTNFFRDPAAFETLERAVIPRLFEGKGPDDTIRVWVPGCATGEEAYSIAMLLKDFRPKSHAVPKLQIFASDIDEHSLEVARAGRFPATIAKDVPTAKLERYFLREDGTYRIISEIREICLFAMHNLLRDAPFSKLDLISCRNLLIYLNSDLQTRIVPLLHYALRDGGFLFLGTSENVTRHTRLFATVDKTSRIFQRRTLPQREFPEFPLATSDVLRRPQPALSRASAVSVAGLPAIAERKLRERYTPAHVIINAEGEILYSSGRTGKYLELPAGVPETNILNMTRRSLRLDFRAALHKAIGSGQAAVRNNVSVDIEEGRQAIDLIVDPLQYAGSDDPLYLVVFRDIGGIKQEIEQEAITVDDVHGANVSRLEAELRMTRERLQTVSEELESSNEELKSSNEELSSMNEELQSANEELETSKEELQSINEELQTVNAELSVRVEELSRSNSNIANLLESTQIATVFLDRDLCVTNFTPAARELFHLVESDAGRPITHVRSRFRLDTVEEDVQHVLRTLGTIEREVASVNGDVRFIMRIMPYRTIDHVIDGVVITFTDVTRISAAEARISELTRDLRNRVESLETLLDIVPVGIQIIEDGTGDQPLVNRHCARLMGETGEWRGLNRVSAEFRLFEREVEAPVSELPLQRSARTGTAVPSFEGRLQRNDGTSVEVMISAMPLFDERGRPRGAIAAVVDISERKQAEKHQEVLLHELQHRVKNSLATISSLATRMLRNSKHLNDFSAAFQERLQAMGRMHDLLSRRSWRGADLGSLVAAAVSPYATAGERNIEQSGPEVLLPPDTSAAIGMVMHELATNAAKYGALAAADGQLSITWHTEDKADGRRLNILYQERLGRPIPPPDHDGFGISFIRRSVEYELQGTVDLAFEPSGVRCAISFPPIRNFGAGYALAFLGDAHGT